LSSLERLVGFNTIDVVIADNCSGEESVSALKDAAQRFSNVHVFVADANFGYFGGAELALDWYLQQRRELPEWIVVCNPDIVINDSEFLPKLYSQDWRRVGVLAPRIRLVDSIGEQNPFMRQRPGWLRRAKLRAIYSNYWVALLWDWLSRKRQAVRRKNVRRQADGGASRESIYAAHGAFFIFSRHYFEAGGYLDDKLFLYGEELSVAEICRSFDLPVVFEPGLCVWHDEHTTTGTVISRSSYRCQQKALRYVFAKYFSDKTQLDAAEA
jgi:GT2 family glycosyltransferase